MATPTLDMEHGVVQHYLTPADFVEALIRISAHLALSGMMCIRSVSVVPDNGMTLFPRVFTLSGFGELFSIAMPPLCAPYGIRRSKRAGCW